MKESRAFLFPDSRRPSSGKEVIVCRVLAMAVLAAILVTLLFTTVLSKDLPAPEKVSSDLDLKLVHVVSDNTSLQIIQKTIKFLR